MLVSLEAQSVTTLCHFDRTKSEAENIKLARLSWTLSVAFTVNHLLVLATFGHFLF